MSTPSTTDDESDIKNISVTKNLKRKTCDSIYEDKDFNLKNFFGEHVWDRIIQRLAECYECGELGFHQIEIPQADGRFKRVCVNCVFECKQCGVKYSLDDSDRHRHCICIHVFSKGRCIYCKNKQACRGCGDTVSFFSEYEVALCPRCNKFRDCRVCLRTVDILHTGHFLVHELIQIVSGYLLGTESPVF